MPRPKSIDRGELSVRDKRTIREFLADPRWTAIKRVIEEVKPTAAIASQQAATDGTLIRQISRICGWEECLLAIESVTDAAPEMAQEPDDDFGTAAFGVLPEQPTGDE